MADPNYKTPFDSTDYLPDNFRDEIEAGNKPLMSVYGQLIDKAVADYPADPRLLMDPLIRDIIVEYNSEEAVNAYFNTLIKTRLGTATMLKLLFNLLGVDLDITEWFKSDIPIPPFKFFIDINTYPTISLPEIVRRVNEVKNERSWLASVRDKSTCPSYFILDKSHFSSREYLSRAIGDVVDGVKYCFTFKRKANYPTPLIEPPSLFWTQPGYASTFPTHYQPWETPGGVPLPRLTLALPLLLGSHVIEPEKLLKGPNSAIHTRLYVASLPLPLIGAKPRNGSVVLTTSLDTGSDVEISGRDLFFGPTVELVYGSYALSYGDVTLFVAPLFVNTNTFPSPTVGPVRPNLWANAQTFYSPVTTGPINPAIYSNTPTFYSPVITGPVRTPLYTNPNTIYQASAITAKLTAPLYTNPNTLYFFSVSRTLFVPLYSNTNTYYSPRSNPYWLSPSTHHSTNIFLLPSVITAQLTAPILTNTSAIYPP